MSYSRNRAREPNTTPTVIWYAVSFKFSIRTRKHWTPHIISQCSIKFFYLWDLLTMVPPGVFRSHNSNLRAGSPRQRIKIPHTILSTKVIIRSRMLCWCQCLIKISKNNPWHTSLTIENVISSQLFPKKKAITLKIRCINWGAKKLVPIWKHSPNSNELIAFIQCCNCHRIGP